MKSVRLYLGILLMSLATISLGLGTGCATSSNTPSGGAYDLKQTRDDVDWAMSRYRNGLEFGFVTSEEQQRVSAAYKAYQSAFNAAAKLVERDYGTRHRGTSRNWRTI